MKIQINEDKLYEIIASSINKNLSEGRFGRMAGTALLGGALMLGNSHNANAGNIFRSKPQTQMQQNTVDNSILSEEIPQEYMEYCKKIANELSKCNDGCKIYVGFGSDDEKLMAYRTACASLRSLSPNANILKSTLQTDGDILNIFVFGK